MSRVFSTEPNPERTPLKHKFSLKPGDVDLPSTKLQFSSYVNALDAKINSSILKQLSILKTKHLQLGGILSGLQSEKSKVSKESLQKEEQLKNSFQQYLMRDIQKFKDHKEFFKRHFLMFSQRFNEAIEKRDKLSICVDELRSKLRELKRIQIRVFAEDVVLPNLYKMRTSKTIKTTLPTERSVRISTDIVQPLSPILMRMGGSQPVLGSRIYQPIKTQSTSSKKQLRRQNTHMLRSLLEQRYKQKDQLQLSNFEQVLFQRRNFSRLMDFFECVELN